MIIYKVVMFDSTTEVDLVAELLTDTMEKISTGSLVVDDGVLDTYYAAHVALVNAERDGREDSNGRTMLVVLTKTEGDLLIELLEEHLDDIQDGKVMHGDTEISGLFGDALVALNRALRPDTHGSSLAHPYLTE